MNRTKIEWTDFTWNPITGCLNDCPYCYARKMYHRFGRDFSPQFHPERLSEVSKVKSGSKIFVGSVTELFGWWMREEWLNAVFRVMNDNPDLTFLVLTKFPQNIKRFRKVSWYLRGNANIWVGVTVNTQNDVWRVDELAKINMLGVKFVSVEPMFTPVSFIQDDLILNIDWIIVGAQTQPYKPPKKEWVQELIAEAKLFNIPIFLKDNLKPIWGNDDFPQEFPRQLVSLSSSNEQTNILGR